MASIVWNTLDLSMITKEQGLLVSNKLIEDGVIKFSKFIPLPEGITSETVSIEWLYKNWGSKSEGLDAEYFNDETSSAQEIAFTTYNGSITNELLLVMMSELFELIGESVYKVILTYIEPDHGIEGKMWYSLGSIKEYVKDSIEVKDGE